MPSDGCPNAVLPILHLHAAQQGCSPLACLCCDVSTLDAAQGIAAAQGTSDASVTDIMLLKRRGQFQMDSGKVCQEDCMEMCMYPHHVCTSADDVGQRPCQLLSVKVDSAGLLST